MPRKLTEDEKQHRKMQREAHAGIFAISTYFVETDQDPVLDNDLVEERNWMLSEVANEFNSTGLLCSLVMELDDHEFNRLTKTVTNHRKRLQKEWSALYRSATKNEH